MGLGAQKAVAFSGARRVGRVERVGQMQIAEQPPGIPIRGPAAGGGRHHADKICLLLGRDTALMRQLMGDRHRQKDRRAIDIQRAFADQRAEIAGEAPCAHQLGVDSRLRVALRPGEKGPALRQRVIQAAAAGKDLSLVNGKQAVCVPLGQGGCFVDPFGKPVGHGGQCLGADGRRGHTGLLGKAGAVVLGAPQGADPGIAPDQQHSGVQRPVGQPAAAHRPHQQGQRTEAEHRGAQLAGAEGQRVHRKRDAPLDGHRNMRKPPVHGSTAAACRRKYPQRSAAARQRGQPAPVGAAPARKFFHKAKPPLVFVPLYREAGPAVKKRALPFCRGQTYLFLALLPKKRYNTIEYL